MRDFTSAISFILVRYSALIRATNVQQNWLIRFSPAPAHPPKEVAMSTQVAIRTATRWKEGLVRDMEYGHSHKIVSGQIEIWLFSEWKLLFVPEYKKNNKLDLKVTELY